MSRHILREISPWSWLTPLAAIVVRSETQITADVIAVAKARLNDPDRPLRIEEVPVPPGSPLAGRRVDELDLGRARRLLGWEPRHRFEEALAATVRWYVENRPWWERIISGEYLKYYEKQYGGR